MSDIYVAKGSFVYRSNEPYNVNQISMELYYLPSVWGEIEVVEDQQLSVDNPNFLIIDYDTPNQKVFAKHIHIGENSWTAEIDNDQVKYVDQNGDDILEILVDELEAKAYVEALDLQNAYFLDSEMAMLDGYLSILDTIDAGAVIQKVSTVQIVNITWTGTISSFPDLATHFPDHDSTEVNTLYQRVFEKAEEPEYKTNEFYDRK